MLERDRTLVFWLFVIVVLVGWALALAGIGHKSLWADEGYSAYLAQQPGSESIGANLGRVNNPLHLLLLMGVVRFNRSEMALRLPSAMAAVLALPVLYVVGSRLCGRTTGLVGAFLLALSPYAINYAQEARSYALFELFALLSLLLLLMSLDRDNWSLWLGFSLVTAVALYTHFFSWFVVGSEIVFGLAVILRRTWQQRGLDRRVLGFAASLLLMVLLYLPWVPSLVDFWQRQGPGTSSLLPGLEAFQFSAQFFRAMVGQFGVRGNPWGFYLSLIGLLVGIVSLVLAGRWRSLLLLAMWFGMPIAFLTLVPSKHFFDFRYLIFILPIILLVLAEGIVAITSALTSFGATRRFRKLKPVAALGLAAVLVVPTGVPALRVYYQWEKENWRGVGEFVEQHLAPDEAIFVAPRYWGYTLEYYEPSLQQYLVGGDLLKQLARTEETYGGLWFVRYAAPLADPTGELTSWAIARGFDMLIDPNACGHGLAVFYGRFDEAAERRREELLEHAATFCPADPRFARPPD